MAGIWLADEVRTAKAGFRALNQPYKPTPPPITEPVGKHGETEIMTELRIEDVPNNIDDLIERIREMPRLRDYQKTDITPFILVASWAERLRTLYEVLGEALGDDAEYAREKVRMNDDGESVANLSTMPHGTGKLVNDTFEAFVTAHAEELDRVCKGTDADASHDVSVAQEAYGR